MLSLARARRSYAAFLVAGIVLFVAALFTERNRSRRSESAHRDCDPDSFLEIVNRPDVYTLDVHVPEQQHIDGTDAFIPYDSIRDHQHLLPAEDTRSRSTAVATP